MTLDFAGNILMPDEGGSSPQPTNPKSKPLQLVPGDTINASSLSDSQGPATLRHSQCAHHAGTHPQEDVPRSKPPQNAGLFVGGPKFRQDTGNM